MRPKNKVKIYVYLTLSLFLVIGFITGLSYAYWMKHFEQAVANELGVSCFELTITDEENDIHLSDAKPISDEEGLELTPYTFRINNTCNTYGFVNINLEVMDLGSEVKEILPEHIHVQLTKTGIELFNDVLNLEYETDPTLVGAHLSYKLNRQFMKASTYEDYELRIWMDKDITNDDLDTIGGSFKSKVNIIFEQTDPLFVHSGTIIEKPSYDTTQYFWKYSNTISKIIVENIEEKENYLEVWDVSQEHDESVMAYIVDNGDDTKTLYLQGVGGIKMPENSTNFFANFSKAKNIENIELLDFSNAKTMDNTFSNFGAETTGDINFDLSSIDVSNVKSMRSTFLYFGKNNPNNINLYFGNDFNASSVESFEYFAEDLGYSYASNKLGTINIDLGNNFNAKSAVNIYGMFKSIGCFSAGYDGSWSGRSKVVVNLGNNFNAESAETMSYMFGNLTGKTVEIYLGKNFNANNAKSVDYMFYYTASASFDGIIDFGDNFNANNATSMEETFRGSFNLYLQNLTIDFGKNFGGDSLTSLESAFAFIGNTSSKNPEINIDFGDYFNTSNVTNMYYMFAYVGYNSGHINLNLSDQFTTKKVTNMSEMFMYSRIELDLNELDFTSVTNLNYFAQAAINLYGTIFIDFNNVTKYNSCFTNRTNGLTPKITINYLSTTEAKLNTVLNSLNSNSYESSAKKGILLSEDPRTYYTITLPENVISTSSASLPYKNVSLTSTIANKYIKSFKLNGTLIEDNKFTMPDEDVEITDVVIGDGIIVETNHYPYQIYTCTEKKYYENTFEGATSITVTLTYETYYSTSYEWIYLYDSPSNVYQNKKYAGSTLKTETITIPSNYIKISFRTYYTPYRDYYGFKAIVTPNYD